MQPQIPLVSMGLLLAAPALAHHDTAVQQVGSTSSADGTDLLDDDGPRIEARATFAWQSFGRLLQGSTRYEGSESSVAVERYTIATAVRTASRTRVDLALPTGRVRGTTTGPFGLGDLSGMVSQELGPVRLGVLATAPTGRYTVDSVASVVEVRPNETGNLDLVTYDARASLGAGAWRTGVMAAVEGRTGRVVGNVRSTFVSAIGSTSDDIRWGSDAMAMATVSVRALADRLSVGTGLLGQVHTADRVPGEIEAGSTESPTLRTSRRRSLGVVGTLGARIASGFACGAQARVPVTQWVQGVQLAESFTVSGQCTLARGFGDGDRGIFARKKSRSREGSEG